MGIKRRLQRMAQSSPLVFLTRNDIAFISQDYNDGEPVSIATVTTLADERATHDRHNCVIACGQHNRQKASRTPWQAGMAFRVGLFAGTGAMLRYGADSAW